MDEPDEQITPDPVTEAYKKDVDRTPIRENLKLSQGCCGFWMNTAWNSSSLVGWRP